MKSRINKKRVETILDNSTFQRFTKERKKDGWISDSEALRNLIIRYVKEKSGGS